MSRRHGTNAAGFTLLEMVVVVAILALMLGLVVPRLGAGGDGARLAAAASAVSAALREARADALESGRDTDLGLDTGDPAILLAGRRRPLAMPSGGTLGVTTARGLVVGERIAAIRFHGDGGSTGGSVTLSGAGRVVRIEVDWLTGRVARAGAG